MSKPICWTKCSEVPFLSTSETLAGGACKERQVQPTAVKQFLVLNVYDSFGYLLLLHIGVPLMCFSLGLRLKVLSLLTLQFFYQCLIKVCIIIMYGISR
jgi:hypothetical protein